MIGQTISHYKILEKLGEGGMGVVYKAHDTKLDRMVALKFLPHHIAPNEADKARFLQEARAAAALNHPHVCSVIDIQEDAGQQFIVMEFVDGKTLRDLVGAIHESPLPIKRAIDFGIQIGEALQAAHAKAIVHRDVKCENIMVTNDGRIKVMDFGLAKLKGTLKLTRTSSTVGTLAYMAPEQLQGGEVDGRSDIFSFGVVLFEMLTGKLPFRGEHEAAMMYSIVNEEPESALKFRPDIPAELDRIIKRALEKNPEDRYQHADDMVSELRRVQKQSTRVVRPETAPAPAGKPAQPAGAPAGRKNLRIAVVTGLILIAVGIFVVWRQGGSEKTGSSNGKKMLVVLPFENLGSAEQEYFADGITEEITSKLSGLSGLGVIARFSANQYKKTTKPIKQIGEELGVNYILQGTVRWENSGGTTHVRVTPQLINVADGTQMWSQPADAIVSSAFTIQSEIATNVAAALNITLLQQEKQTLEAKLTENSEAYDYYLRGCGYMLRSSEERGYKFAEDMFNHAVALDPKFAAAYSKLGELHSHFYWEQYDHTPERIKKSKAAIDQALRLAPNLPDAHGAMGWYYYHCLRDYENAMKEFNIALAAQPNNLDLLMGVGSIYRRLGTFDSAIYYFKRALESDPRSAGLLAETGFTFVITRDYAKADQYCGRAISLDPDVPDVYADRAITAILDRGDVSAAQKILLDASRQNIGSQNPYFLRFWVWINLADGKYQDVINRLASSEISILKDQYWLIPKELLIAEADGLLGKHADAHKYFESARVVLEHEIQIHPEDARIHSSLGLAYAGLGMKDAAVREGKRGVEAISLSREAIIVPIRMADLAQIYAMTGDHNAAIDLLEKLLSIPALVSGPLLKLDPVWIPLRGDPRFQKLVAGK